MCGAISVEKSKQERFKGTRVGFCVATNRHGNYYQLKVMLGHALWKMIDVKRTRVWCRVMQSIRLERC